MGELLTPTHLMVIAVIALTLWRKEAARTR
jgi:hypothetical protein